MNVKKILLLLPPQEKGIDPNGYTFLPPFGLGILAGYLQAEGYEVDLSDLNQSLSSLYTVNIKDVTEKIALLYDRQVVLDYLEGKENEKLDEFIGAVLSGIPLATYDLIGISVGADFTFMQIHMAFLIGSYLAKRYPCPLVFGGNNITFLYLFSDVFKDLWKAVLNKFPFIFKGPGEIGICRLIDYLRNKKDAVQLEKIGGLVYWRNGTLSCNEEYEPMIIRPHWSNLSMDFYSVKLKDPDQGGTWDQSIEMENLIHLYKWPFFLTQYINTVRKRRPENGFINKTVIPYIFNYHCPFNCAFCTQSDIKKRRVIMGEVETVINDLEFLKKQYQTNYFYFFNNAANASAVFIEQLCRELIRRRVQIHWSDCGRFNNLNYERLRLMREAGCRKLVFGFETGSEKLLKLMNKKLDLGHAEKIINYCYQLGIWVDLEIIVGLPHEEEQDCQATADFVTKNRTAINYMTINEFFIVPNSLIGRYPERYGIEILRNVTSYDKILQKNFHDFKTGKINKGYFKIYRYNEIGGRDYRTVVRKTKGYIKKMNDLQNKEFAEVEYVYRIMDSKFKQKGEVTYG